MDDRAALVAGNMGNAQDIVSRGEGSQRGGDPMLPAIHQDWIAMALGIFHQPAR
jgi:hypothetical protein